MATYGVRIYELISHYKEVDATSEQDAYNQLYNLLTEGNESDYETESEGFTGMADIQNQDEEQS